MAANDCDKVREIWLAEADGKRPNRAERDLLEAHLSSCAACRAEAVLVRGMRADDRDGPAPELDDLAERRWIAGAIERAEELEGQRPADPAEPSVRGRRVRPLFVLAAGLAVAAAVTIGIAAGLFGGTEREAPPRETAPRVAETAPIPLAGTAVLASGEVTVDGAAPGAEAVRPGARIDSVEGLIAIDFGPAVTLLFDNGGRARVAAADESEIRIELAHGRLIGEVDPERDRPRLRISTEVGDVVVTGTVFSVEVTERSTEVKVFRGGVRVEEPGRDARKVRLGQALTLGVDRVASLEKEEQAEVRGWMRALDMLGGSEAAVLEVESIPDGAAVRVDEVLIGRTPLRASVRTGNRHLDVTLEGRQSVRELVPLTVGRETRRAYELAEVETGAAARGSIGKGATEHDTAAPAERATPADLLITAQGFRASGDYEAAAATYEELATHFPASAEGRAALVSAGTINLERLGRPSRALLCFDRYLASVKQGTLAQEAALGRAQAFKALGDAQREAAAIEEFLARFPGAIQAPRAKRRLEELKPDTR